MKKIIFYVYLSVFNFAHGEENINVVKLALANSDCKPDNLPLELAEEKGWFKKENIEFKREADVDLASREKIIEYYAKNLDLLIAGRARIYHIESMFPNSFKAIVGNVIDTKNPGYAIIVKKDSSHKKLGDLNGKRIGLEPSSGHAKSILIDIILKKNKLDPKKFNVNVATLEDLENGKVDALYLREPELAIAKSSSKYRIIMDAPVEKYIMSPWPMGFAALSSSFIKREPELSKKIVGIFNQSIDYMRAHPDEVKSMTQKCLKDRYNVVSEGTQPIIYWKIPEFNKDKIQKQMNLYFEKKLIPTKIKVENFILK